MAIQPSDFVSLYSSSCVAFGYQDAYEEVCSSSVFHASPVFSTHTRSGTGRQYTLSPEPWRSPQRVLQQTRVHPGSVAIPHTPTPRHVGIRRIPDNKINVSSSKKAVDVCSKLVVEVEPFNTDHPGFGFALGDHATMRLHGPIGETQVCIRSTAICLGSPLELLEQTIIHPGCIRSTSLQTATTTTTSATECLPRTINSRRRTREEGREASRHISIPNYFLSVCATIHIYRVIVCSVRTTSHQVSLSPYFCGQGFSCPQNQLAPCGKNLGLCPYCSVKHQRIRCHRLVHRNCVLK